MHLMLGIQFWSSKYCIVLFIDITPRSTLIRIVSTCLGLIYKYVELLCNLQISIMNIMISRLKPDSCVQIIF